MVNGTKIFVRSKVTSEYVKQCAAGGNKLVEHAAQLTDDDLTIMMTSLLFKRNDRQADKDRGIILILQKQTIGRISETSRLKLIISNLNPKLCLEERAITW